jgi:hypothetical protein
MASGMKIDREMAEQIAKRLGTFSGAEDFATAAHALRCHCDLVEALEKCVAQLAIVLPTHGRVHDERQALISAAAALARAKGE